MEKIRTIVVGVAEMHDRDPKVAPPGEDPVLAPATTLTERLGATLHVVQAFERPEPLTGSLTDRLPSASALQRRRAEVERRLWAQTRCFPNADRIHVHGVEGEPALQLCAFAEEVDADLVIVGASRRNGIWHNFLGSTAERVLQRSAIPVLVVRHPFRRPVRRVLLTTDLSETSPELHEAAMDTLEPLFGSEPLELRTLLVCWYDSTTAARVSEDFMSSAARAKLRQFLAERRQRSHPVEGTVRLGNPSTEILRAAGEWKADLLVLGSHGQWGVSRWVLGSTAAAVLRGASCNALVIPAALASAESKVAQRPKQQRTAGFPGTEEHHEEGVVLVGR